MGVELESRCCVIVPDSVSSAPKLIEAHRPTPNLGRALSLFLSLYLVTLQTCSSDELIRTFFTALIKSQRKLIRLSKFS